MNYERIHSLFIDYFKGTNLRERLMKRNPEDPRLKESYIYSELHHIIPRSFGGDDSPENLVRVLPEEHLFLHFLRFKIFKSFKDLQAVKMMLNGYSNPSSENKKLTFNKDSFVLNKHIRVFYALHKQECQKNRKQKGWHTEEGVKRISDSMKGKVVCKDAITGELTGKHDRNHPKILSGEWVQHSRGMVNCIDIKTKQKLFVPKEEYRKHKGEWISCSAYHHSPKGEGNVNYSGVTDEEILELAEKFKEKYKFYPSIALFVLFMRECNFKIVTIADFRFKEYGGGNKGFINCLKEKGEVIDFRKNNREKYLRIQEELKNAKDKKRK